MNKTKIAVATLFLLTILILPVAGCGPMETKTYDYTNFTSVEVSHALKAEITQCDSYSISITASENLFNYIQVLKEGETLIIGLTQPVPNRGIKAEITMPDLQAINFSGATKGTITGFNSSNDFSLKLSGASTIGGDLSAGDVDFDISGASTVSLDGTGQDIYVNASGASKVNLDNFPVNNTQITLSGASTGTINLRERLDADLSGASKLYYIGEPTMGDINTSGASTISKK